MAEKNIARAMPIGSLSDRTGVKVETIRYYEQVGLLPQPERSEGNQRRFGRVHVERLAFIKHACDEAHAISVAHLDDVRHKIARLRSLEKELERIAATCSGGVTACDCKIIEALADHGQCRNHAH